MVAQFFKPAAGPEDPNGAPGKTQKWFDGHDKSRLGQRLAREVGDKASTEQARAVPTESHPRQQLAQSTSGEYRGFVMPHVGQQPAHVAKPGPGPQR